MSDGLDPVDDELRRQLTTALDVLEVDVDAHWERLVANCRAERRRSVASRVAVAAGVLLVLLTAGRPLVVTGAGAVVRFVSDVAGTTADRVAESIEDQVGRRVGGGGEHAPIDEENDYWMAIRSVHEQLNDAVGWSRWEPEALDGAAAELNDIADQELEFEEQTRSAANLIRKAQADDDRDAARKAHRIIEGIERGLRAR